MVNRIREARKAKGFTMKQLGTAVDVAESTISQYETGKREPDNKTLLRISEVLNVSVDYLLGKTDIKKDPAETGEVKVTDKDIKFALFDGDEDIPEEVYEDVKRYAAFLREKYKAKF